MPLRESVGKIVLIVEDNEICREGLATVLGREGYSVITVEHGREALDRLRGGLAPDLILLDMMLPVDDGWDFLSQRKRDPVLAAIPVVITTGLGIASPEWAASLGATGLLHKPLDVFRLLNEVRRCLTR